MNDRAVSVFDNYEIEVLRSWKGRGAILCETNSGILILKEYKGKGRRLEQQKRLLDSVKQNGYPEVEEILVNKEGNLITYDDYMNPYIVKSYRDWKECSLKAPEDYCQVIRNMARLHKAMDLPDFWEGEDMEVFSLGQEFAKHNRELKKVRRFLKAKSQKTEFERALMKEYDFFFEKALCVQEAWNQQELQFLEEAGRNAGKICHGDFQHHNTLLHRGQMFMINFDKFAMDNPVRDISLFLRKLMEKNNWAPETGTEILEIYHRERGLKEYDWREIYYRISYPEKFRKIVNFYFNSSKAWIPGKNLEKLEKILLQEKEKSRFLQCDFWERVLH